MDMNHVKKAILDKTRPKVRVCGKSESISTIMIGNPIIDENYNTIGIITDIYPNTGFWCGEIYKGSDIYEKLLEGKCSSLEFVMEVENDG